MQKVISSKHDLYVFFTEHIEKHTIGQMSRITLGR